VGAATVSRVLNDSRLVSEGTRERVLAVIEELGYRRSAAARNLRLGRSQAVGVVAPFLATASVTERLRGVIERLTPRGYDLLLFAVERPEQRVTAVGDFALSGRVDGLLVVSLPLSDDDVAALRRNGLPVVLVDVEHRLLPSIHSDDLRGGELAAEHLLAKGHSRIGFVGDRPDSSFGFTSSERRRRGGCGTHWWRSMSRRVRRHGHERCGGRASASSRARACRRAFVP
jgi:DNA-binding LacI/PurR family transcriptional regulator